MIKDMLGLKCGRLLVIARAENAKDGSARWLCECECGKQKIALGANLRRGSAGCRCITRGRINHKDLKDQVFGNLRVISLSHKDKSRFVWWNCVCSCGNNCTVKGSNLISSKTRSCGCLKINNKRGPESPTWNPSLTQEERERGRIYNEYYEWKKAVYKRDKYTCQCCGKKGGRLAAHHLFSYRSNPEKRLLVENGIILCKNCHETFHKIYGRGNNTPDQFYAFLKDYESI